MNSLLAGNRTEPSRIHATQSPSLEVILVEQREKKLSNHIYSKVACKERGMRAIGMSEKAMKTQLSHWLDLSLNANIPTSLLLLSRDTD